MVGFLTLQKANKDAHVASYGGHTVIYTDGGCQTTPPFIGAYAFSIKTPASGATMFATGTMLFTTNNRMELMAIYKALEDAEIGPPIILYSDSMYAIQCLTEWGPSWVKKGWTTGEGKPVKNRELIEPLLMLVGLHTIEFKHVKGHAGNVGNTAVDELCVNAIKHANYDFHNDNIDHGISIDGVKV